MGWLWKSTEEKWGPWSKPCYSGNGNFSQVRFRLSDNKMEKRDLFVNIAQHEIDAAWKSARAGAVESQEGAG